MEGETVRPGLLHGLISYHLLKRTLVAGTIDLNKKLKKKTRLHNEDRTS
jgi:hypothetical protein